MIGFILGAMFGSAMASNNTPPAPAPVAIEHEVNELSTLNQLCEFYKERHRSDPLRHDCPYHIIP